MEDQPAWWPELHKMLMFSAFCLFALSRAVDGDAWASKIVWVSLYAAFAAGHLITWVLVPRAPRRPYRRRTTLIISAVLSLEFVGSALQTIKGRTFAKRQSAFLDALGLVLLVVGLLLNSGPWPRRRAKAKATAWEAP